MLVWICKLFLRSLFVFSASRFFFSPFLLTEFLQNVFRVPIRNALAALLFAVLFVGCKGGDEAPPKFGELIPLLNSNAITGYGWQGSLASTQCGASDVVTQVMSCAVYQSLEQTTLSSYPDNATLNLQLNANTLTGYFTLILPGYNLLATNAYQLTGVPLSTEAGYDTGSGPPTTVRYTGSPVTAQSANSTQVQLVSFSAQQDSQHMPGTMQLLLSMPGNSQAGTLSVTYAFNWNKLY